MLLLFVILALGFEIWEEKEEEEGMEDVLLLIGVFVLLVGMAVVVVIVFVNGISMGLYFLCHLYHI